LNTRFRAGAFPTGAYPPTASPRYSGGAGPRHYRDAFERSQDPLVNLLKDVGGTIGGAADWLAGRFRGAGSGAGNGNGGGSAGS
jgi:hypothetical protein